MKIFVNELKAGDFITDQVFSIEEFQQHKTRAQNPYYRLILQDKTGEIAAKIWQDDFGNCRLRDVTAGDVVKVDAEVNEYNGQLQLIIKKLEETDDYDISDLVQASERNLEEMFTQLLDEISKIKNKHLKKLFQNILDDKNFVNRFKRSPAAEKVHHDFMGGLLEHSLEVVEIAKPVIKSYPEANKDLTIAGLILHDIGKTFEFEVKKTALTRSVKGKLLGHLALGVEFVETKLPKDFPEDLWMRLAHIIISHQGELEFGSPIKPATIEAAIVHYADYTSSHVKQFQKAIKLGEGSEPGFSEYQKWIGTQVYLD